MNNKMLCAKCGKEIEGSGWMRNYCVTLRSDELASNQFCSKACCGEGKRSHADQAFANVVQHWNQMSSEEKEEWRKSHTTYIKTQFGDITLFAHPLFRDRELQIVTADFSPIRFK